MGSTCNYQGCYGFGNKKYEGLFYCDIHIEGIEIEGIINMFLCSSCDSCLETSSDKSDFIISCTNCKKRYKAIKNKKGDYCLEEFVGDKIMDSPTPMDEQMAIHNQLFEYEKNCLSVIKEFKEEIKFASSLQEDIRKERTSFFLKDFAEISKNLKESQIDDAVAAEWLKELVNSYTKSLDLSSDLAKTHMLDLLGIIKSNMKETISNNTDLEDV